jgi:anthranilate synthase component 1
MISKQEFLDLASDFQVVPIVESVFSGTETPLSIFEKLAASEPGSFLLESAEAGVWSRYSFIGVHSHGFLTASDESVIWNSSN